MSAYWSIKDFLVEEQNIQVMFTRDSPGMDFLDKNKAFEGGLPKDQPVGVPAWKAEALYDVTEGQNCLQVKIPDYYRSKETSDFIKFVEGLGKANIDQADLMKKNQFFYELALTLKKPLSFSADHVQPQKLAQIYTARADLIMAKTFDVDTRENDMSRKKYCRSEIELFQLCRSTMFESSDWKTDSSFARPSFGLLTHKHSSRKN